jgi:hypothetical protein
MFLRGAVRVEASLPKTRGLDLYGYQPALWERGEVLAGTTVKEGPIRLRGAALSVRPGVSTPNSTWVAYVPLGLLLVRGVAAEACLADVALSQAAASTRKKPTTSTEEQAAKGLPAYRNEKFFWRRAVVVGFLGRRAGSSIPARPCFL